MLPRVSAALAQFIAPIKTSASSQKQGAEGSKQAFERFKPDSRKRREDAGGGAGEHGREESREPKQAGGAQVIPLPLPPRGEPSGPPDPRPLPAGISQALLQLMSLLHEQRASILRWLAVGIYQSAARNQKKNGRARKGTIIDQRAE